MSAGNLLRGIRLKRGATCQNMKKGGSEGVEIAAEIFLLPVESFRRDVVGSSPNFIRLPQGGAGACCQTKIGKLRNLPPSKKNITGLDIPMNEAGFFVGEFKRGGDPSPDKGGLHAPPRCRRE